MPTTTMQELEIRRLTGRRPEWQRRAIRVRLAVVAVTIVLAVAGVVGAVEADTGPVQTTEHRVRAGDTLWGIASGFTRPGEDVRVVVRSLMDLNDLTDSSLAVGQVLIVPLDS